MIAGCNEHKTFDGFGDLLRFTETHSTIYVAVLNPFWMLDFRIFHNSPYMRLNFRLATSTAVPQFVQCNRNSGSTRFIRSFQFSATNSDIVIGQRAKRPS
jgi:hypothetical protein